MPSRATEAVVGSGRGGALLPFTVRPGSACRDGSTYALAAPLSATPTARTSSRPSRSHRSESTSSTCGPRTAWQFGRNFATRPVRVKSVSVVTRKVDDLGAGEGSIPATRGRDGRCGLRHARPPITRKRTQGGARCGLGRGSRSVVVSTSNTAIVAALDGRPTLIIRGRRAYHPHRAATVQGPRGC